MMCNKKYNWWFWYIFGISVVFQSEHNTKCKCSFGLSSTCCAENRKQMYIIHLILFAYFYFILVALIALVLNFISIFCEL